MLAATLPLALGTAAPGTCGALKTLYRKTNACCGADASTPANVTDYCKSVFPCPAAPGAGTAAMPSGIRQWHTVLNTAFHFLIQDGKLMAVTWDEDDPDHQAGVRADAGKHFRKAACEWCPSPTSGSTWSAARACRAEGRSTRTRSLARGRR